MENKEFTVHDRLGPFTVTGVLLVDQRFGSDRKPRWTDMALYQIVETVHDWRLTLSCGGCSPPRTLLASEDTLTEGQIICAACAKPFAPDERQQDKPFRYALEIIARSWVYHRADGPCVRRRHMINAVGSVQRNPTRWRNLYPCPTCKPLDLEEMRADERIAEERSDTHVYLCSDAAAIVSRLYRHSGEISQMAARMLREAARKDPDIAMAWKGPRRI
jgi:hypothetical protein